MSKSRNIYLVTGLHFGDEGKGTIVDFLAREKENPVIVRYGGPQAAHNVVTPEGIHHTFSQLGSGMFVKGAKTLLSHYMWIQPLALMLEHKIFENKVKRSITKDIFIDKRCKIITPYHRMAGRITAKRLGRSTCGMGVGIAHDLEQAGLGLYVIDIASKSLLKSKLENIASQLSSQLDMDIASYVNLDALIRAYEKFYSSYNICVTVDQYNYDCDTIILEGSQGTLLQKDAGFAPHVTKLKEIKDVYGRDLVRHKPIVIGVLRCYSHRHGQGPLPTENMLDIAEHYNENNEWQGPFRTGLFDPLLLRHALRHCNVDYLAVTHLDRFPGAYPLFNSYIYSGEYSNNINNAFNWKWRHGKIEILGIKRPLSATEYLLKCKPFIDSYSDYMIEDSQEFIKYIESTFGKWVAIESYGPCATDKKWRRNVQ